MQYRRKYSVLTVAMLAMLAGACSQDAAVTEDLGAVEAFAKELVSTATSGETPAAGIEAAQAYLDENQADVSARMQRIGGVRGFQIDDETKARLTSTIGSTVMEVNTLKITFMRETMGDESLDAALNKLVDDFNNVLKTSEE